MRVAPMRAQQLRSQRANGYTSRYQHAPACSNPQCGGLCYLCSADSSSPAMTPDEGAEQARKLASAITRAHRHAARHSPTPAIVKRGAKGETVLRSAAGERDKVRRARIGTQATRDAATFRRMMSADERRDPSITRTEGPDGITVRVPA